MTRSVEQALTGMKEMEEQRKHRAAVAGGDDEAEGEEDEDSSEMRKMMGETLEVLEDKLRSLIVASRA